jgi:NAD(P)H dehydrogenase (quinone)
MAIVAIVYHSGYGHTKRVADVVAEGIRVVDGVNVELHEAEAAAKNLDALDAADTIVFGAPTYMGGASAGFKTFADASSKKWMKQAWKDKLAAGFTNSGSLSGDKLHTLQYFAVLAAQHGMIWVGQGEPSPTLSSGHGGKPDMINRVGSSLGLMTQSDNSPPDQNPSEGDLATARLFGTRIGEATLRWAQD